MSKIQTLLQQIQTAVYGKDVRQSIHDSNKECYHALTNAGHISYVEMDGDPSKNLEAFEAIIRHMKECGIGYGSINHPVDRDPVCGYNGIINDVCPCCGRREYETIKEQVKRWRPNK